MMSGKPAEVQIEDREYNSYLAVKMEGAPMDIEALCNASACTTDPNATEVDEILNLEERESEWSGTATFSLMVLAIIVGVYSILLFCFLAFQLVGRAIPEDGVPGDNNEQLSLVTTELQVLQFCNINKTVYLNSDAAKAHGKRKRRILDNITGSVESGSMMGVMGPRYVHYLSTGFCINILRKS